MDVFALCFARIIGWLLCTEFLFHYLIQKYRAHIGHKVDTC